RHIMDKAGFFPLCGEGRGLRQPVHARDLALAAFEVLHTPATEDRAYDLSGAETLTYAEMAIRIGMAGRRKAGIIRFPEWLWEAGFTLMGWLRPNEARKNNLEMARRMNVDLVFSHEDARRDFGYAPSPFRPDFKA